MRVTLFIVFLSFTAISCIDLGFDNPQPLNEPNLDSFPTELTGVFANKEDTLIISESMIISGNDSTKIEISDEMILRYYQGWYFLNLTESGKDYWTVICARRKGNKLILQIPEIEEEDKEAIAEKWEVRDHHNSLGNLEAYIIAPDKNEWKKLLKSKFFSKATFKKLKDSP